jgi:cytochrome oxidase assembly protein ShyY1
MRSSLLWFLVLALLTSAGLASLGMWQWQRAADKEALLAGIDAAVAAPPMSLTDALQSSQDLRFRAVTLSGRLDLGHQVLLDNQLRDGQPGVRVYLPFVQEQGGAVVLIDGGWLAWPDRSTPPPRLTTSPGLEQRQSILLDPPGAGLQLGASLADNWPLLVTRIDLPDLRRRSGLPLLDWVAEDRDAPRAQSIRAGMLPPERHRGYAVQWFGLAATVLIIYFVLAWRSLRRPRVAHS